MRVGDLNLDLDILLDERYAARQTDGRSHALDLVPADAERYRIVGQTDGQVIHIDLLQLAFTAAQLHLDRLGEDVDRVRRILLRGVVPRELGDLNLAGRNTVHRDGDVCRFRLTTDERNAARQLILDGHGDRRTRVDAAEVDLTEVDLLDVAQHRLIARDNLYFLRVDDALHLILRQAAAVLEGNGQRNVVDAVDRNRNLDFFGLAGDIVRGERRTVLIIQGYLAFVVGQRGIAAGNIHGCNRLGHLRQIGCRTGNGDLLGCRGRLACAIAVVRCAGHIDLDRNILALHAVYADVHLAGIDIVGLHAGLADRHGDRKIVFIRLGQTRDIHRCGDLTGADLADALALTAQADGDRCVLALDELQTGRCFQLGRTDDTHRHIVKAHVALRIVNIHNNCPQNDRQRQRQELQQKILLFDKILLHLPAPPFHLSRMAAIRLFSFLFLSSSPSSSLSSIFCRISGDRWRLSMPPMATEVAPVSSETTTSTLSAVSLMPTAARWRVPRSRDRP